MPGEEQQHRVQNFYNAVRHRAEGRILSVGLLMSTGMVIFLLSLLPWEPDVSFKLFKLSILHIISGRAAGISYGYSVWPDGSWIVIPVNIYLETVIVMVVYPLFVFSLEKLFIFSFLQKRAEAIRTAAERHRKWVKRFGMVGLFLFVWLPFWMTGPLVGCIIGYLLHLKAWINLTVVLAGTSIAIICWAIFLQGLQERLQEYSAYAPLVIVTAVVLFSLCLHIVYRLRGSD